MSTILQSDDLSRGPSPQVGYNSENATSLLSPLRVLFIATFSSGGCALLLEQVYEKYLATLLGASRPAATVVLATFFLGLALGGLFCPKRTKGSRRRLAALEFFVGAWAVFFIIGFFRSYDRAATWLAAADGSSASLTIVRFVLAVVWILPPTIAMGAQLPTLTAVLESLQHRSSENLTRFYSINIVGGLAFTLTAPTILFNFLGADGALWVAAGLSVMVGTMLWFGLPPEPVASTREAHEVPGAAEKLQPFEIGLAAACGFTFFALEVLWFHLISTVCGASTYSFSLLLAVVLLSLAIAGWQTSKISNTGSGSGSLARVLFGIFGRLLPLLAVSNAAWPYLARVLSSTQTRLQLESFWAGEFLKFSIVSLAVIPPALALGMVFPLVLRGIDGHGAPGSRRVGWICASNVVGCVAGSLIAGFVMIPAIGSEWALHVLWMLLAASWLILGWKIRRHLGGVKGSLIWGVLGAGAFLLLPSWNRLELTRGIGIYLREILRRDAELVFFQEDYHAGFVTVIRTPPARGDVPTLTLLQNGKFDADNDTQMSAQIGLGAVAALHVARFESALIVGCGSGQTASTIDNFGFEHVEIAELSPSHLRAANEWFSPINHGILENGNAEVIVEDGRNWLLRSPRQYDLIQVEISSIWFAGATNLYSREFYELVRRRLAPRGVLLQWFQLHHLTERELASIIGTIQRVLPEVTIWRVGLQACVLASLEPQTFNPTAWERWTGSDRLTQERRISGMQSVADLTHHQLLSSAGVQRFLRATPHTINTDRNRWLEFQTPKYYLSRRHHESENLELLRSFESTAK